MMWDDEVDVVCCDSGFGGLATAIAAVDAGLDVFVARPDRPGDLSEPAGAGVWLGADIDDPQTRDYFDALTADLGPREDAVHDADVAIRAMADMRPAELRGPVEPFYGARLTDWTAQCLVSPYGVLYTRLSGRDTTPVKTPTGETIEVKILGAIEPESGIGAASAVNEWLLSQMRARDIHTSDGSSLQRIVFDEEEEGQILGVVLATADGPLALRAHHGVAISTPREPVGGGVAIRRIPEYGQALQVCLVGHSASRFGRVELLAPGAATPQRAVYCRPNRLHEGLHDAGRSYTRGSREVHGYPPLG